MHIAEIVRGTHKTIQEDNRHIPFCLNTPSEVQQSQNNSIATTINQQLTTGYTYDNHKRQGETQMKLGGTERG